MRVNLQVLGCRLNEAELQQWAVDFRARGHDITSQVEDADLLVVNTCAVTGEAGRKSRQLIRRAHRNNPQAKLVVSGCYATLEQQQAAAIEGVDLVVPNRDKNDLVERVQRELDLPVMPVLAQRPSENALFQRGRSRAFIKVQDGCRWRCTYCIVTIARGAERSTPQSQVIDQISVFERAVAVVDAVHTEQVERFDDVLGRAFLAGVRDAFQTQFPGAGEHPAEQARRVPHFGGIQAHAG